MSALHSYGLLALAQLLFFRLLRLVKYQSAASHRSLAHADYLIAAAGSGLLVALSALHLTAALLAVCAGTALFFILWLDAALYRIFTVELGASGIGDVVLSNLVAEMRKMRAAQRFFQENRLFTLLPIAALVAHLATLLPQVLLRGGAEVLLVAYLIWSLGAGSPGRAAAPSSASTARRALVHDLLQPRRPRIPPDFCPRPEHASLLLPPASMPQLSAERGLLRGSSVVLLTFESLGAAHLARGTHGRALTPFLDSIAARRTVIRSARHSCLAPLTNAAHIALYFSRYTVPPAGQAAPLHALQKAGYKTVYLTSATVEHYGLAGILHKAGFEHLIDGRSLASQTGSGPVSDHSLPQAGVAAVQALRAAAHGAAPLFLHVHGADSHIPYRVVDPARFQRHDLRDDRGRFLNSIEESDWIFGELWDALRQQLSQAGQAGEPLLVLSSDHGQAFGEHGYWSHGSAVISEELDVPLLLYHPRLAARAVPFSTHFDVLPTICELLDVELAQPGFGASLLRDGGEAALPAHFVWDGAPSRSTGTCLGLLLGRRKYALDLVRDTCVASDLDDSNRQTLMGDERTYFEALIGRLAQLRGVG